tara:strand:- start:60173 stop:61327 length:1155 start_codon:yes stop_codon:yes gene_type:complete
MYIFDQIWIGIAASGTIPWLIILLQPWQSWRNREDLIAEASDIKTPIDLSDVTVLIPARNEETLIIRTLNSLENQGKNLHVIVIDDQSTDKTGQLVENYKTQNIKIKLIKGKVLPDHWAGKLWALQQGLNEVNTSLIILMDADINLANGMIKSLIKKREETGARLVSVMVKLQMESISEKLLIPAFIFFFKLLYPFSISNSRNKFVAASAGGCVLIDRDLLNKIDGFNSIKGSIIDDCSLARAVKSTGALTWIGLTKHAFSNRSYPQLRQIWKMVSRSAFTQLNFSIALLMVTSFILITSFWFPLIAVLFAPNIIAKSIGSLGLVSMIIAYTPILLYYKRSLLWHFTMPIIGLLFMAMTWESAINYWLGKQSCWKERVYSRSKK